MGKAIETNEGVCTLEPGTILRDQYQITRILGSGRRALVYQGRDMDFPEAEVLVAIKGIHPSTNPDAPTRRWPAFAREASILLACHHDAIPKIYEVGAHGDVDYMMIEYINGMDLVTLLDETRTLPLDYIIRWGITLCDALEYLHNHKPESIIHNNVAPENIMINSLGDAMLVGWGAARFFHADAKYRLRGVERYMAPERYQGIISPQTDMFGLGATLHHVITRTNPRNYPPFTFHRRPLEDYSDAIPDGLGEIIYTALAIDPRDRFWDMHEMKIALSDVLRAV